MIIALMGKLGSAKTCTMTMIGYMMKKEVDMFVVSNYHTSYTDKIVSNPEELDRISKEKSGIQMLDEVWSWADSRDSGQGSNDTMTDLVINSRKRGWVIVYTTQFMHQVDRRLRDNTDIIGMCEHEVSIPYDKAKVTFIDRHTFEQVKKLNYKPDPLYDMYDTNEEVSDDTDAEKYEERIEEIKEMVETGEIEHKTEIVSYLKLNYDMSRSTGKDIADEVFRIKKNEVKG